jgi:hypothetical protein
MIRGARMKFLSLACSLGVLTATALVACNLSTLGTLNSSDWFVKSVKTDAHGDAYRKDLWQALEHGRLNEVPHAIAAP